ncbi:hypothetical protein AGOR_G00019560 [Albula goreensis]|uniref:Uncharacterized protein n=1 Tax=Albula goreensis TaxID=1534307 RepID=A0A8T3E475_9TELE|nr:hypothetical protein AGOR_G00019560 [Albula goreensis]
MTTPAWPGHSASRVSGACGRGQCNVIQLVSAAARGVVHAVEKLVVIVVNILRTAPLKSQEKLGFSEKGGLTI